MLLPAVTLIVLLVTRRRFDQGTGRGAARTLTAAVTAALGLACGAFLLLGYLLRDHFSPRPQFGVLAQDLPTRFLAGRLSSNHFVPADPAGRLLYIWVFLLFWIVILGALTAFFRHTRPYRDADAADRARAILTRGGSTLSYMSTWTGNQYWFSPLGQAAIAYRAIAAVAVTVGGPTATRPPSIPRSRSSPGSASTAACSYACTASRRRPGPSRRGSAGSRCRSPRTPCSPWSACNSPARSGRTCGLP